MRATIVEDDAPLKVPDEVVRFFSGKALKPAFDWRDVWAQEHAFAFTVAKATQVDVLTAIHDEVGKAIAGHRTFGEFRAGLEPRLKALGWWGDREAVDPTTGELRKAALGSPRRLRLIYEANTASARAAGEWHRIERRKRILPYLLYARTSSKDPRPEHLGWVGTILPVDHPFWRTHYPPNGWNCKCRVEQIGRVEAERRGYDPSTPAPAVERMAWRNRRTGATKLVPAGIDPGWSHNPGRARARVLDNLLAERLEQAPAAIVRAAAEDLPALPAFREFVRQAVEKGMTGTKGSQDRAMPIAVAPEAVAARLLGTGAPKALWISEATIAHKIDDMHGIRPEDWSMVQQLLDEGEFRVQTPESPHPRVTVYPRGPASGETPAWFLVIGTDAARERLLIRTMFRPTQVDHRARRHDPGEILNS